MEGIGCHCIARHKTLIFFATFFFRLRKKQTNFKLQPTVWKRQRLKAGCNNYLRGTRSATNYGLWVSACGKEPLDDSKEPQLRRVPFVRFFDGCAVRSGVKVAEKTETSSSAPLPQRTAKEVCESRTSHAVVASYVQFNCVWRQRYFWLLLQEILWLDVRAKQRVII